MITGETITNYGHMRELCCIPVTVQKIIVHCFTAVDHEKQSGCVDSSSA